MRGGGIEDYYDRLAPYYKFVYSDWEASVRRQASALDSIIREFFGNNVHNILDAACGIGTQSIGLAKLGYSVTASDISGGAVKIAQAEASRQGLKIDFSVADMRDLRQIPGRPFELVLACDNAIPHLLTDDDILSAFRQFHECLRPGGGCILSVRDYGAQKREEKVLYPRHAHETAEGKAVLFDLWEFDGDYYDITTYVVEDRGCPAAEAQVIKGGRYYCVSIEKLEMLLGQAGFKDVRTLRDRFFQPVIIGKKKDE